MPKRDTVKIDYARILNALKKFGFDDHPMYFLNYIEHIDASREKIDHLTSQIHLLSKMLDKASRKLDAAKGRTKKLNESNSFSKNVNHVEDNYYAKEVEAISEWRAEIQFALDVEKLSCVGLKSCSEIVLNPAPDDIDYLVKGVTDGNKGSLGKSFMILLAWHWWSSRRNISNNLSTSKDKLAQSGDFIRFCSLATGKSEKWCHDRITDLKLLKHFPKHPLN